MMQEIKYKKFSSCMKSMVYIQCTYVFVYYTLYNEGTGVKIKQYVWHVPHLPRIRNY
jgi:hypothetical protein